jgi:branched-chain amino acid transport system substrate-binding protein
LSFHEATPDRQLSRNRPPILAQLAVLLSVCLITACGSTERPWGNIIIGPGQPILVGLSVDADAAGSDQASLAAAAGVAGQSPIDGHDVRVVPIEVHCGGSTPSGIAPDGADLAGLAGYIGGACSSACVYAEGMLYQDRTTMIASGCTSSAVVEQGFSTVFRIAWNDNDQGRIAADYARNSLKARRVAVVTDTSAYARSMTFAFVNRFRDLGGTATELEIPVTGPVKAADVASRIKASGASAVFFAIGRPDSQDVLTAVQPLVSPLPALASDTVLAGNNGLVDGIVATGLAERNGLWASELDSGAFSRGLFEAQAADAATVYVRALNKVAKKRTDGTLIIGRRDLRNAIAHVQFAGQTGRVSFDSNGEREHDTGAALYRVQSGQLAPLMQYER